MSAPDESKTPDEIVQTPLNENEGPDRRGASESAESALHDSPSPGQRIRAARESAGLSLEELASMTKLARHVLEALEADRFEDMSEAVYVRGYYRKCAKVLEIDEDTLIRGYQSRVKPVHQAPPAKVLLAGSNPEVRRGGARGGLLLVLVLALILSAVWWARRAPSTSSEVPMVVGTPAAPTASAQPSAGMAPAPVMPAAGNAASSRAAAESAADDGAAHASGDGEQAPVAPAVPETVAPAGGAGEAAQTPAPEATAAASREQAVLQLEFVENSWVQVEDAAGETLISRLATAGQRREIRGEPPLTVFVGYAPGVRLSYNGQPVDLKPHTRSNDTARLTLPDDR